jgi:hypothetical protein
MLPKLDAGKRLNLTIMRTVANDPKNKNDPIAAFRSCFKYYRNYLPKKGDWNNDKNILMWAFDPEINYSPDNIYWQQGARIYKIWDGKLGGNTGPEEEIEILFQWLSGHTF